MLSDGDASDSGQLSSLTMTRYNNDQKTSGKDAYGVSWNDFTAGSPPIDYSKQMINTFTIGFGSGLSKAGKKFLDQGASCIYTPPDAKPGEIVTSPPSFLFVKQQTVNTSRATTKTVTFMMPATPTH